MEIVTSNSLSKLSLKKLDSTLKKYCLIVIEKDDNNLIVVYLKDIMTNKYTFLGIDDTLAGALASASFGCAMHIDSNKPLCAPVWLQSSEINNRNDSLLSKKIKNGDIIEISRIKADETVAWFGDIGVAETDSVLKSLINAEEFLKDDQEEYEYKNLHWTQVLNFTGLQAALNTNCEIYITKSKYYGFVVRIGMYETYMGEEKFKSIVVANAYTVPEALLVANNKWGNITFEDGENIDKRRYFIANDFEINKEDTIGNNLGDGVVISVKKQGKSTITARIMDNSYYHNELIIQDIFGLSISETLQDLEFYLTHNPIEKSNLLKVKSKQ